MIPRTETDYQKRLRILYRPEVTVDAGVQWEGVRTELKRSSCGCGVGREREGGGGDVGRESQRGRLK